MTGKTAQDIASLRPNSFIIAATTDRKVARSLSLKWGVYTSIVPIYDDTDDIVKDGVESAKNLLQLNKDDIVVVVGGSPATAHTNFIKIERI